jgi:endo-1,4-beta-xylanase
MRMNLRKWIATGATVLLSAAVLNAMPASAGGGHGSPPSEQSLRALADRHRLSIGTAVDMAALNDTSDPKYRRRHHQQ